MKNSVIVFFFLFSKIIVASSGITEFNTGKIKDTIKCLTDTNQSYAIYLPSTYTSDKSWPILFGFEPGARGQLPIAAYHELAEKYKFIIACSNNAKNGHWEPQIYSAEIMINDIRSRFNIDETYMYTFGFSGGGRLATLYAMRHNDISGVINCGAGFPNNKFPRIAFKFYFVGIIGIHDMNYIELNKLNQQLTIINMKHSIIPFLGSHNWPTPEIFEEAILHIVSHEAKGNTELYTDIFKTKEKTLINTKDTLNKSIIEYQYNLLVLLEKLSSHNEEKYTDTLKSFKNSNEYKSFIKEQKEILNNEEILQDEILYGFKEIYKSSYSQESQINFSWWKKKINKINHLINNENNLIKDSGIRLKNFIGGNSYERLYFLYQNNELKLALQYNEIACYTYPTNYYLYLYKSKIHAKLENYNESIKTLQKAINLGYQDIQSIYKDSVFTEALKNKKFSKFIYSLNQ